MGFEVRTLPSFEKDILALIDSLELQPIQGTSLGNDFYKIRLAIRSKGKGKSGGARIITCVKIVQEKIFLAAIYDKADVSNISNDTLKLIAKQIPK